MPTRTDHFLKKNAVPIGEPRKWFLPIDVAPLYIAERRFGLCSSGRYWSDETIKAAYAMYAAERFPTPYGPQTPHRKRRPVARAAL